MRLYDLSHRQTMLWIQIHWIRIRIRIRIQSFKWILIRIRIQGFDDQKLKKKIQLRFFFSISFWSKFAIYLFPGHHKEHTSYRRSLQPSQENIQHFQRWNSGSETNFKKNYSISEKIHVGSETGSGTNWKWDPDPKNIMPDHTHWIEVEKGQKYKAHLSRMGGPATEHGIWRTGGHSSSLLYTLVLSKERTFSIQKELKRDVWVFFYISGWVLGSIPASPDIEESEGRQMKPCGIKW